jgi:deoxyribonuclease-1
MKYLQSFCLALYLVSYAYAAQTELPSYYPQDFIELVSNNKGLTQQSLRAELKAVISRVHVKNPGQRDQLADRCPTQASCSVHVSLGYNEARKHLFGSIHLKQDKLGSFVKDVYCHKVIRSGVGSMKIPDANILNCEHTWPQSKFTPSHSREMQKSDLHHLYPTDNQANSTRGNHPFAEVDTNIPIKSDCDESFLGGLEGRGNGTFFEPPAEHKGNVARAIFYFSVRYEIEMPTEQAEALKRWNDLDPVDQEEKLRNDLVEKAQGNRNPFIDAPELIDQV